MRVRLKKMEVFSLKASSLSGSFARSTVTGPTWRQDTEKLEGSLLSPKGWPHPPLRACEIKQATPGTAGSSNSLTQTLSLGDRRLKVVLMHGKSSARAAEQAANNRNRLSKGNLILASIHVGHTFAPGPPARIGPRFVDRTQPRVER